MRSRVVVVAALALAGLAPHAGAQRATIVPSATSGRIVLTPELVTQWLAGATAMHAAMIEWEALRTARTERLLARLRDPGTQRFLACRDALSVEPRYRTLTRALAEARDAAAIHAAQGRLLERSRATCGPLPDGLFDPDTAVGPEAAPDFILVALRASGLDRTTFARVAERLISWAMLEARY